MGFILIYSIYTDIVLKVRQPSDIEAALFRDQGTLISFLYPAQNQALLKLLANKQMNAFGKLS